MKTQEYSSIYRLKKEWNRIYRESERISNPFQSFTPNRIYYDVFHLSIRRLLLHPHFIYAKDGDSEAIFPIVVDRRRKRITEFAPLDYFDVPCLGSTNLIPFVLRWIKSRYPGYAVVFSRVNQSSTLFSIISDAPQTQAEKCVQIPFKGESYDDYYLSLSKHQRQNLRTAYNRLDKENISLSLAEFTTDSLHRKLKRECETLYEKRKETKNAPRSAIKQFYTRITKPAFRIMAKIESGAFFLLYLNGKPAAVMAGAYTKEKDVFIVPVLFSNGDLLRYSPGILLVNEVAKRLIKKGIRSLDLARGEEPYKYAMGGTTHLNYTLTFNDQKW